MHTVDKIHRLIRASKLYGKPFFNRYPADYPKIESVVRTFVHKLFGTKSMDDEVSISTKPMVRQEPVLGSNFNQNIYEGLMILIEGPYFRFCISLDSKPCALGFDYDLPMDDETAMIN